MVREFGAVAYGLAERGWRQVQYGCRLNNVNGPDVDEVFFGYSHSWEGQYRPAIVVFSANPGELEPIRELVFEAFIIAAGTSEYPDLPVQAPLTSLPGPTAFDSAALLGPIPIGVGRAAEGVAPETWLALLSILEGEVAVSTWGLRRGKVLGFLQRLKDLGKSERSLERIDREAELQLARTG